MEANNSFGSEEGFSLQDEIEERNDALDELTSILGGSSSCPSFPNPGTRVPGSGTFERPGCLPKFLQPRASRAPLRVPSRL